MEYRHLGNSGLQVSALSLGSWVTFDIQNKDTTATRIMELAYEKGINFFDNAEGYAQGESEKMMGRVLKKLNWDRTAYLVSSKVFFGSRTPNKPNQTGLSRKHIMEACHEALQRIQVDYLDLFFCHRPDPAVPMQEVVWAMNHLLQQGKILYWGTSEWNAQQLTEAHRVAQQLNLIGPTMEQPEYNLINRHRVEVEYKSLYQQFGMGTTIWSPLASGLLTGKYLHEIPQGSRLSLNHFEWLKTKTLQEKNIQIAKHIEPIAKQLGVSMACLSIAWCLKNKNVSTVILGASKEEQLLENLTALNVLPMLTDEVMLQIEAVLPAL